jgi:putative ABC transport system ATP-binding protein
VSVDPAVLQERRPTVELSTGASVVVRDVFRIFREADVETVALRGIDFEAAPGEYVALMGRSGSGKSTLLNLMAGADRPSAGTVRIDGVEVGQAPEETRTTLRGRTIGHVVQEANLVEFLDLEENVRLAAALAGARLQRDDVAEALGRVGLSAMVGRRPAELSGGEQQRAALAMVLATRPHLLLADEITGQLDRATAAEVLDVIDLVRAETNMTIVAATHDPAVAARADRVAEIVDGRMLGAIPKIMRA